METKVITSYTEIGPLELFINCDHGFNLVIPLMSV